MNYLYKMKFLWRNTWRQLQRWDDFLWKIFFVWIFFNFRNIWARGLQTRGVNSANPQWMRGLKGLLSKARNIYAWNPSHIALNFFPFSTMAQSAQQLYKSVSRQTRSWILNGFSPFSHEVGHIVHGLLWRQIAKQNFNNQNFEKLSFPQKLSCEYFFSEGVPLKNIILCLFS